MVSRRPKIPHPDLLAWKTGCDVPFMAMRRATPLR
jgi:hypothetical protein